MGARGFPTELTSNHLSTMLPDKLVDAGGTVVNLIAGAASLWISKASGGAANRRYFFWIMGALNLLPGAGYFLFSGIFGFGDWNDVIAGLPHQALLRVGMSLFGAALYLLVVRWLAVALRPFVSERSSYNDVGRLPYYAACLFSCLAGVLDPLGWRLLVLSTIPAAFGGSSGLMWADSLLPREPFSTVLIVSESKAWWVVAFVLGMAYVIVLGRGIRLVHAS